MGRPTKEEMAAKKAAEEKAKADALAQQLTGTADTNNAENDAETNNEKENKQIDIPKQEERNAKNETEKFITYDHVVKVNGKFYAAGEHIPVK